VTPVTAGHAKEALDLARMQEQSVQMEHQSKVKVLEVFAHPDDGV